jgi:hypothetical protein
MFALQLYRLLPAHISGRPSSQPVLRAFKFQLKLAENGAPIRFSHPLTTMPSTPTKSGTKNFTDGKEISRPSINPAAARSAGYVIPSGIPDYRKFSYTVLKPSRSQNQSFEGFEILQTDEVCYVYADNFVVYISLSPHAAQIIISSNVDLPSAARQWLARWRS